MSSYSPVVRLSVREGPRLFQSVLEIVDDEHPAGTHQPRRLGGVEADRAGAEHGHGVTFCDVGELSAEVPGGQCVGTQQGVLVVHPVGNDRRTHVGEGHAHELRLATVIAAAGVRVAVDAADRGGVGIDVVAVG